MKKRLDILVSDKFEVTRNKAQALIMAGLVFVEGKKETKSGGAFDEDAQVSVKEVFPYVSRGALKLKKAYEEFNLEFMDKIVCDIGASTGGFTDFALQHNASKVYAIDTGYGQMAQKLREDERVTLLEKTNIKSVESLPEPIDFFVIDVSFISLKQVLPAVKKIIHNSKLQNNTSHVIALVKPQFEVGKAVADKTKGIIRDEKTRLDVVRDIGEFSEEIGFRVAGLTESPITGAKGNKEFLMFLAASY